MCTVTFLTRKDQVFITSNRDESPGRRAIGLYTNTEESAPKIHYPLDETSGGSWISLSDSGRAVCLLNGAYEAFIPNPPYRMSRGKIVLEAARAKDAGAYMHRIDLDNIAPFTLLVYEHHSLQELVWDGEIKHLQSLPVDLPYIWSSATLYPPDVRAWRKSLFDQWLRDTVEPDRDSILAFHQMANGDPGNGFVMNRNEIVKTLSITSIALHPNKGSMMHYALEQGDKEEIQITYDG